MDRISELPDALLFEILSYLPTREVVTTMVLSKRWKYLYTFVPTLEYDHNSYPDGEDRSFSRFVYSSLLLHEAPVLQVLSFVLGQNTGAIDIGVCVRTAIKRHARHLNIEIDDTCSAETINPVILPTSLYTGCTMLVSLGLNNVVLTDTSSAVSFPSLKNLAFYHSVPECLSASLETLEWVRYQGSKEDKEVATFILRSGRCLKKVTISSTSTDSDKKLEMLKELSLSFRRSPTCQLAFN
ncbi:hypothetical protein F2Q68_00000954 [Brassica cretica]|uniref:F-box domain-containing protein n=1 Tax=Brassica cretica TaxID=69181 RepID=A0A8S9J2Z4_BRACR|nr:hypothetical protein F2Q68_00000954 [Brassica cretica]